MSMAVQVIWCIGSVVVFRILLDSFCKQVEDKKRLACVAGMMLAYTVFLMWMIYMAGEVMFAQMAATDFRVYVCVLILGVNIVVGFITILYCSTARKRSLSNREKIMLKDL